MKQSAAKTLGVAVLGAAFAVAGAGAANAAPAALPDAAGAVNSLTSGLPLEQATSSLPAGGAQALAGAQNALGNGLTAAQPVVEKLTDGGDPVNGLLGGLPTNSLPTQGLPVGGGLPALG
ncbi:ATP-binding protein [Streptomyces kunmingensis]|uniref:ATP-binding protein n=1 Tax=Streptomyces kunmingensis TaxID=68225 RepID=A0ABU6CI67_9ACTN|nr:ATP-binding protein [Streptomyces kunmingensis]MEB3964144.1 ATP-binding protein [Streptomyces kunmingensis]